MSGDEEVAGSISIEREPVRPEPEGVVAGIVRAFEVAAGGGLDGDAQVTARPEPVRLLDEAFGRAEAALGSNVVPFKRKLAGE